jgi:hypothetical protein
VFSARTPSESPSTSAAAADGARPITESRPCAAVHARCRARSAVVLPEPAGPTSRSRLSPERAMRVIATAWSGSSRTPLILREVCRATSRAVSAGPPVCWLCASRRCSASRMSWLEYAI